MTELTTSQQRFVEELVSTACTPTEAARRSGYADPGQESWRLMRKPHVVQAVRELRDRLVSGHAGNVAVATLVEIMQDREAAASARVSAARTVIEAAGGFEKSARNASPKRLEELSTSELSELVARLDDSMPSPMH